MDHGRDLRLDLFRGYALFCIFFNHIPNNVAHWLTTRSYGFSDATEIFVFVSGYSAALAYGGMLRRQGFAVAAARILQRCWQVYCAHILLFVVFIAHIAYVAEGFENPMLMDEMNLGPFFDEPHRLVLQALMLTFKPVNMDVLPLYVVLLLFFAPLLLALERAPLTVLALSAALWLVVQVTHVNLPNYPKGGWVFNPFAWQFLFVLGAWCATRREAVPPWRRLPRRLFMALALGWIAFGVAITATWAYPPWGAYVPRLVAQVLYPISKSELDWPRLLHFAAIAYAATTLLRHDARVLRSPLLAPVLWCGQQSLAVFCVGVFLSFVGHVVLTEVDGSLLSQVLVSAAGVLLLVGLARLLNWLKDAGRPARPPSPAMERA
ncbi:MAG: OpgC domain-containing protein [Thalassobaculales bacterium]